MVASEPHTSVVASEPHSSVVVSEPHTSVEHLEIQQWFVSIVQYATVHIFVCTVSVNDRLYVFTFYLFESGLK